MNPFIFENERPADNSECLRRGKCTDPFADACPCKLNSNARMRNTARKVYLASSAFVAAAIFTVHVLGWW